MTTTTSSARVSRRMRGSIRRWMMSLRDDEEAAPRPARVTVTSATMPPVGVEPLGVDEPTDLAVDVVGRQPVRARRRRRDPAPGASPSGSCRARRPPRAPRGARGRRCGMRLLAGEVERRAPDARPARRTTRRTPSRTRRRSEPPAAARRSCSTDRRTSRPVRGFHGGPDRVAEQHARAARRCARHGTAGRSRTSPPVDGVVGDVDRRHAVDDPVRHHVPDPAAEQDAERVHALPPPSSRRARAPDRAADGRRT